MPRPLDSHQEQADGAVRSLEHREWPAEAVDAPDGQQTINAINQRIFETSLDLILVVDRRGTFIRVSPSARTIIGYDPAELIGRSAREILYPPDLDKVRDEMRLARHGRLMRNFECRYVHRDGRVVPLSWMGVWSEPEQQHFFIGRDISDREAVEQRLRQAQRMDAVGQLTGGMAHDFNNLLGIIIANLDMLRDNGELDARSREMLGEALDAALRGADLTRRLLAFARRQPLQPERVAINELVVEHRPAAGPTLGEHIPIPVNLAGRSVAGARRPGAARGEPRQPGDQCARCDAERRPADDRHRQPRPRRRYAARHAELVPGDYVMIEVSDTGTGMPPELLARVFEPFFTTKETGKGTGLGLSMVFGFVKQSGGHVNVYSEPGSGTTFRLYLPRGARAPRAEAEQSRRCRSRAAAKPSSSSRTMTGMRRVVRAPADQLGYRVIEAETAAAALEMLARETVALLFTDIVMPGEMDGVELARIVAGAMARLKVVLTSGFPEARLGGNGDGARRLRLLSKPYRRDDLARTLREALDDGQSGG